MRLDHLIYQQRWSEAEEFAQTFSLNMEACLSCSNLYVVDETG